MGAKDVIKALLERLPDDCKLGEVIDELIRLEVSADERDLPPLTQAQREALDESLAHHERHPERAVPWSEFRRKLERGE